MARSSSSGERPTVPPAIAGIAKRTKRSVAEVQETWSERAAIREYVGGHGRAEAERLAYADTEALLKKTCS
jgi:hypothetical protein